MKPFWIGGGLLAATFAATGAVHAQGCGFSCGVGGPDMGPGCGSQGRPCPWIIDNCAQIPRRAQPAPAGTYVNRWLFLQEQKAELDDFVFYQNMWFRGGTELGPMGRYYLDLIANRLPHTPFPVVIETSRDDRLDEARREVLITLLERRGLNDPSRIIVAYPIAEGLLGAEAPRIAAFYLSGGGLGYGGGLGGGFGGGGFGGGGFGGFGGFTGFGR
ncbi:MAG TPA: hypothetical protein VKA46_37965 [Gemmataceae bacterium]|nr:hypothetical protein [Gemmataceae bacterium]